MNIIDQIRAKISHFELYIVKKYRLNPIMYNRARNYALLFIVLVITVAIIKIKWPNKAKLVRVQLITRHGARSPLKLIPGIEEVFTYEQIKFCIKYFLKYKIK